MLPPALFSFEEIRDADYIISSFPDLLRYVD